MTLVNPSTRMISKSLTNQAEQTWQKILGLPATERTAAYWSWCQYVIDAQKKEELTIEEAASLLIWPKSLDKLEGLETVADILIVLDTAYSLDEGGAYVDAEELKDDDWADLVKRVDRHIAR